MSPQVRLAFVIHNHQPIGNFEGVFDEAYHDSYLPFLSMLEEFPEIHCSLHNSGSLLEWLVKEHPEYIDRLRRMVSHGQIEVIGGPFFEPILAGIPQADRVGQICAYSDYLEELFGQKVRGMWMPERVWEQSFTGNITRAGIEYTVLDDYHFKQSGLRDEELHGYFLTEDEGRIFKVFPGSERLRYTIPFASPEESIAYLRSVGEAHPGAVVTFGDDGEKFGTWPGTKEHVYNDGWLRHFFETLRHHQDWLKVTTLQEVIEQVPPLGRCYFGDCSYREMTEWALTTPRQTELVHYIHHQNEHPHPEWELVKHHLRGGFWRNFRVKYPEANEMYTRMIQVSRKHQHILHDDDLSLSQQELLTQAQMELYRGECNCPYWHGAFGGLYLPHLRHAIYHHLIRAENLLDQITGSQNELSVKREDFNLDAFPEVLLSSSRLKAWFAPHLGGQLYGLDVRTIGHNLLATLDRRPEPYHETIREAAHQQHDDHSHEAESIHDLVRFKQPDLDQKLIYDSWPRKGLIDHFLQPGLSLDTFQQNKGLVGNFANQPYDFYLHEEDEAVQVILVSEGNMGPYCVKVTKIVSLAQEHPNQLRITYQLEHLPDQVPIHFGVELQFAGLPGGAPDRYYYDGQGERLGQLDSTQQLDDCSRISLIDEWLGIDISLNMSETGMIWAYPLETVSQSEGGFEAVHQSCVVLPHWEIVSPAYGQWTVDLDLTIDTSAAQARMLRENPATKQLVK